MQPGHAARSPVHLCLLLLRRMRRQLSSIESSEGAQEIYVPMQPAQAQDQQGHAHGISTCRTKVTCGHTQARLGPVTPPRSIWPSILS